jgi:hypothetical protein
MAEYKAKRNPDRCPSHPGAVLRAGIDEVPAGLIENDNPARRNMFTSDPVFDKLTLAP